MTVRTGASQSERILEALAALCEGLLPDADVARGGEAVAARNLPSPFRELLDHEGHMTDRLTAFHGAPVRLQVLRRSRRGDVYRRQIVLMSAGSDAIVEYGMVRMNLALIPEPARSAILEESTPLGDILAEAGVLRRIEPRWYLRFAGTCPLLESFRRYPIVEAMETLPVESPENVIFGRIGSIHCNGEEAIELLEIVVPYPAPIPRQYGTGVPGSHVAG